jgi:hypothetical protein
MWEPTGGQRKEWRHLQPGDLIVSGRKAWRVHEVRAVPVIDWDEQDGEYYRIHCGPSEHDGRFRGRKPEEGASEEAWTLRPVYLVISPAKGGKQRHVKVLPYVHRTRWVLHPHYPVCVQCGEPWPCPELDIKAAIDKQAAELARLEAIMPGCCWECGEPITSRHKAAVFDGENLLLPGAAPVAFHLRQKSKGGMWCRSAAIAYEEKWVAAGTGRKWRFSCPGNLVRHLDGQECTELAECPGSVRHLGNVMNHRFYGSGEGEVLPILGTGAEHCRRCQDAVDAGFYADQQAEYLARKVAASEGKSST